MKYEANFFGLYRYILVIYHFFSLTVKYSKKIPAFSSRDSIYEYETNRFLQQMKL